MAGIGRMLESYEQEAGVEAGLWGCDCRQMENKAMKGKLQEGRFSLHLYPAAERASVVMREGKV